MRIRSNPYVFPSKDFKDLSFKRISDNFSGEKEVDFSEVGLILSQINFPQIKINSSLKMEDQILSFFMHPEIRFGPKSYIKESEDFFKKRILYFYKEKKPISFTLLGFPFKIPVLLKTNRILPDMGEVLFLYRLYKIAEFLNKIYPFGVKIYIFGEGGFAPFVDVLPQEAQKYFDFLVFLNKKLNFDKILKIYPLSEMEKEPDFEKFFEENIKKLELLYKQKDKDFLKKFKKVFKPIFRIVNSREYSLEVLMDVYNENLKFNDLSGEAKKIRKELFKKAQKAIFQYFAYLKTRDDLNYLEKKVPFHIPLTVSPKLNRLGIWPIRKNCWVLPYHGVPIFWEKENKWDLEYLIDLRRRNENITKVFLEGDREKKPFFYIIG